jgi:dihydrofolate reductase
MRKLIFGMNRSLDGYIAAPGDDLGWSVPSDELFQWWSDRVGSTGLALYGRRLWETMSSHWPTADQRPGATPAQIEFARRWREMPKIVFSSTAIAVDWNARLVTGDAVTEITRLKTEDGGPMDVGGATLAAAANASRPDRRVRDRHPPGPAGRRHAVLHGPGQLGEPVPGGDPDVSRRRAPDEVRDQALNAGFERKQNQPCRGPKVGRLPIPQSCGVEDNSGFRKKSREAFLSCLWFTDMVFRRPPFSSAYSTNRFS